jgi:hypothetical protein
MSKENLDCCNTENSDCNTNETNCCSTEKTSISSNKKKVGLGILLLAITIAVVSTFSPDNSTESPSCGSEESCETTCETGSDETSCCSKK